MSVLARYFLKESLYLFERRYYLHSVKRAIVLVKLSEINGLNRPAGEQKQILLLQPKKCSCSQIRSKYSRKSSSREEEESDSDEESEDFKDERDSKVIKTTVNSLRADLILKAGLGLARNKVEVAFYESRIRVNGQKLLKKSVQLNVGDEVDIIKGFSTVNPSLLVVGRVAILSTKEKDENILAQLRRYKSLLIENYEGANAYRSSDS